MTCRTSAGRLSRVRRPTDALSSHARKHNRPHNGHSQEPRNNRPDAARALVSDNIENFARHYENGKGTNQKRQTGKGFAALAQGVKEPSCDNGSRKSEHSGSRTDSRGGLSFDGKDADVGSADESEFETVSGIRERHKKEQSVRNQRRHCPNQDDPN